MQCLCYNCFLRKSSTAILLKLWNFTTLIFNFRVLGTVYNKHVKMVNVDIFVLVLHLNKRGDSWNFENMSTQRECRENRCQLNVCQHLHLTSGSDLREYVESMRMSRYIGFEIRVCRLNEHQMVIKFKVVEKTL